MTLKEKFKKEGFSNCEYLEQVADEFAIGFAEWLNFNFKLDFSDKAFEELLLVYKKEKEL
jgi:hypothetical protein